MSIKLRCMKASDSKVVHAINAESFDKSEAYDYDLIAAYCSNGQGVVAVKDGSVVGYAILADLKSELFNEKVITVVNIAVAPSQRRQGIAEAILKLIAKHIKKPMYLHVRTKNETAIRLYKRVGFIALAIIKDYYNHTTSHDSAYYMEVHPTPCISTSKQLHSGVTH
jgi:ribosomal protein S18 acetylase RimI-like enzyme